MQWSKKRDVRLHKLLIAINCMELFSVVCDVTVSKRSFSHLRIYLSTWCLFLWKSPRLSRKTRAIVAGKHLVQRHGLRPRTPKRGWCYHFLDIPTKTKVSDVRWHIPIFRSTWYIFFYCYLINLILEFNTRILR